MFQEKVYQRRGTGFCNSMKNKGMGTECHWVPGTPPAKFTPIRKSGEKSVLSFPEEKRSSTKTEEQRGGGVGLIDVNRSIYDIDGLNKSIDDKEVLLNGPGIASVNVASQEPANLTQRQGEEVDARDREPDSVNFSLPESNLLPNPNLKNDAHNTENLKNGANTPESYVNFVLLESNLLPSSNLKNDVNNPENLQHGANFSESCLSQHVQNAPEELISPIGDEYLCSQPETIDKKKPGQNPKPKSTKHRPRVLVEGKLKKNPQPKTPKKTPQPTTPKPANEPNRKRKRVNESTKGRKQRSSQEYWLSGDVGYKSMSRKRRCVRENSKNNSKAIIVIAPAYTLRPRRALNFDDDNHLSSAIEALTFDNLLRSGGKKKTRGKRRKRLNVLFMRDLLGLELPKRKKRSQRTSKRCNLSLLTSIPISRHLPKLPSKQESAAPSSIQQPESGIPSCSQQPQIPSLQQESGIPICIQQSQLSFIQESRIPSCSPCCIQLPQMPSLQQASGIPTWVQQPELSFIKEHGIPSYSSCCIQQPHMPSKQQESGIPICSQLPMPKLASMQEPDTLTKSVVEDLELQFLPPLKYGNFSLTANLTGSQGLPSQEESLQLPEEKVHSQGMKPPSEQRFFPEVLLELGQGMASQEFKDIFPDCRINLLGQGMASQEFMELLPDHRMNSLGHAMALQEFIPDHRFMELLPDHRMNSIEQAKPLQEFIPEHRFKELLPDHRMNSLGQAMASQEFIPEHIINSKGQGMISQEFTENFIKEQIMCSLERLQKQMMIPAIHSRARQEENNKALVTADRVLNNGSATIVPYQEPDKSKKRAKVDRVIAKVKLDDETIRMWSLIMKKDDGSTTDDQKRDREKEKWWQKERKVFEGRIRSFTSRMTTFLGDRRFKPWKGSVVDSVVGVYLTQNVSDNLSSSAYMSLASKFPAKFPVKSTSDQIAVLQIGYIEESMQRNMISLDGNVYFVTEPEPEPESDGYYELKCRMKCSDDTDELRDRMKYLNDLDELRNRMEYLNLESQGDHLVETKDMEIMKDTVSDSSANTSQLSSVEKFKADVVPLNKSFSSESSVIASIKIPHVQNTTLQQQDLHNKGDRILSCEECLENGCATLTKMDNGNVHDKRDKIVSLEDHLEDGYLSSTRMDDGSQASTSGRNDLKSVCGSISLSDFLYPLKTSISPSNQENSQIDISKSQNATAISQKRPRRKGRPRVPRGKIDMSQPQEATGTRQKRPQGKRGPRGKGPKLKEPKSTTRKSTPKKKKDNREQQDWEILRRMYSSGTERSSDHMDSVDWEAVRCAEIGEIADAIKDRGQQNVTARRIKDFLNRLVDFHNCIDLEWLRNAPPDKVKEYLLEIQGLGLKSVECIRLLSLQQIAFPVDVNVGRIAVRLGWVPLQPLPGNLHIHLLEQYPVLDSIQMYLWPRLCCLDQRTLYELHYQMITFGKVFCTKLNPNCAACPLRGECKHFASAFASARLALPGPSQKGVVKSDFGNLPSVVNPIPFIHIEADPISESECQINNSEPIIELPPSPRTLHTESPEIDLEDFSIPDPEDFGIPDIEDIPTIRLQERAFKENVQSFMEMNKINFQDSRSLVVLTAEAASIPPRKLKSYNKLRTEHMVYVLPQNHELLQGFERLEAEDPCPYLLAIWSPGETPNSYEPPKNKCDFEGGKLCKDHTCYSCNNIREQGADIVRGTILIPCRTANRGRFPLNGTYFQLNEVFADHETSYHPINVPRKTIANLPTQIGYFGTATSSIFKGLDLPTIQKSFSKGFMCVRGFDRRYRAPRPLSKRFHCSPSKKEKKKKTK